MRATTSEFLYQCCQSATMRLRCQLSWVMVEEYTITFPKPYGINYWERSERRREGASTLHWAYGRIDDEKVVENCIPIACVTGAACSLYSFPRNQNFVVQRHRSQYFCRNRKLTWVKGFLRQKCSGNVAETSSRSTWTWVWALLRECTSLQTSCTWSQLIVYIF